MFSFILALIAIGGHYVKSTDPKMVSDHNYLIFLEKYLPPQKNVLENCIWGSLLYLSETEILDEG